MLVQSRRDTATALRLMRKLLKSYPAPEKIVTDELRCSVPLCGGTLDHAWRDELWAKFFTAAPPLAFHRLRRWNLGQLRHNDIGDPSRGSKLVKRA